VLEAVNAVGNNSRTLDQIQKKVKNIKQNVKKTAASNKKSFLKLEVVLTKIKNQIHWNQKC
jgi:hypothetical protein